MAANEWCEEFFSGMYERVLAGVFRPAQTRRQTALVKRLLKLRKPQRVLDIPCGMGRLTIPLARQGLKMTGVDLTPSYLRRARRRARELGLDTRFVRGDMRRIRFDSEFDAAFNWFGSFGYFTDAHNLLFAKRVFAALKPGGRFLLEGINKSWLRRRFRAADEEQIGDVRIVHQRRWDDRRSRVHQIWTMSDGRRTERRTSSIRLYDGADIRKLLRAAGFREIQLFGAMPLGRLSRHRPRLIAVATRSKSD